MALLSLLHRLDPWVQEALVWHCSCSHCHAIHQGMAGLNISNPSISYHWKRISSLQSGKENYPVLARLGCPHLHCSFMDICETLLGLSRLPVAP